MKKAFLAAFVFIALTTVFGQNERLSVEQLQMQLNDLELKQQEAKRDGQEGKYTAEIRQLQTLIRTETLKKLEEGTIDENKKSAVENVDETANFTARLRNFFVGRELLDNLIIIMGAVAVLAALFLIFTRLFLAISAKSKKRPPKKPNLPKNAKTPQNTNSANVMIEIDRYKEKEAQKTEISESVIYSLKELASINRTPVETEEKDAPAIEEEPKKMRPMDIKNEIVKRFDYEQDIAKLAQEFNISQDQVLMILRLAGRK